MVAFIVSCYVRCAAWCFTAKIRSMTYLELDECSTNRSIYLQFIFADDERSIKKKKKTSFGRKISSTIIHNFCKVLDDLTQVYVISLRHRLVKRRVIYLLEFIVARIRCKGLELEFRIRIRIGIRIRITIVSKETTGISINKLYDVFKLRWI